MYDFIVVGGGISGLVSTYWLKKGGLDICVIEKEEYVGGSIKTIKKNGFLVELGPNTVLDNSPYLKEIVEGLSLEKSLIYAKKINKKRYIYKEGKLLPLPSNPLNFFFSPIFSFSSKLKILREPFVKRVEKEETIAEFTRRRLSEDLLKYAVGPFVSGVYAGDPEKLSVQWATKKIYALERDYGSLIKGAIAKRKGPAPSKGLFSFKKGLYEFVESLSNFVERVFLNTEVEEIIPFKEIYKVIARKGDEKIEQETKGIILTGDSISQGKILKKLDGSCPFSEIPYASVVILGLGFKREEILHPLDGFGFLIPQIYNKPLLGCLFSSSLFDDRVPSNFCLLTAFLGGALHPEVLNLEEREILEYTLKELKPILKIRSNPEFYFIKKWERAIPQYNLGHKKFVDWAKDFEKRFKNIYISGNLLYGISVADCITNASELSLKILKENSK